ncbi:hypothetical protein San01_70730 [Streptomyces angustmyceticus]|uniref:Uncharacterized protein n=1 Tax=Streptomyces angustmyceticus TaxID=285578 RepID=A0A5J4LWC2_9ACTN|nr:hypothetical protein San01_70730 [Streptomyces angustmyceticus]
MHARPFGPYAIRRLDAGLPTVPYYWRCKSGGPSIPHRGWTAVPWKKRDFRVRLPYARPDEEIPPPAEP